MGDNTASCCEIYIYNSSTLHHWMAVPHDGQFLGLPPNDGLPSARQGHRHTVMCDQAPRVVPPDLLCTSAFPGEGEFRMHSRPQRAHMVQTNSEVRVEGCLSSIQTRVSTPRSEGSSELVGLPLGISQSSVVSENLNDHDNRRLLHGLGCYPRDLVVKGHLAPFLDTTKVTTHQRA